MKVSPDDTRAIWRSFTASCQKLGLDPEDPEIMVLITTMVGAHYACRGCPAELRANIHRMVDIALDRAEAQVSG